MGSWTFGLGVGLVALSTVSVAGQISESGLPVPIVVRAASHPSGGAFDVTISNTGSVTVLAWSLKITHVTPDGSRHVSLVRTDRLRAVVLRQVGVLPSIDDHDGIGPGDTLTVRVPLPPNAVTATAESSCAILEDGSGVGDAECVRTFYERRQALAAVTARWIPLLRRSLDDPVDSSAGRALREAVRAQGVPESPVITSDDADFAQHVTGLAARSEEDGPAFRSEARRLLEYWTTLQREALKHLR